MKILETDRLVLRRLTTDDAEFILELLNEPSYLRYIGDKRVRTLDDARGYLLKGPMDSYERFGFGLYMVLLKESGVPIGLCGLLKREFLEDPEVGYAFLPQFWSRGYAFESAAAALAYGRDVLGLDRIVAITTPDNEGSIRVLEKLGLKFDRMIKPSEDGDEVRFFVPDA
jgi:[ribosomal protein S5]-alanine N-acetyltransferase